MLPIVKEKMRELGLDRQADLARQVGIKPHVIKDWFSGKAVMLNGENLSKMLSELNIGEQNAIGGELDPALMADAIEAVRDYFDASSKSPPKAVVGKMVVLIYNALNEAKKADESVYLSKTMLKSLHHQSEFEAPNRHE